MSDVDDALTEPFRRLLADISTAQAVRNAEAGEGSPALWAALEESGYLDALVAEDSGGAGLTLASLHALTVIAGQYLLPAPFAETALARAVLAQENARAPMGAAVVLLAPSAVIPLARHATHALGEEGDRLVLREIRRVSADPFGAGGGLVEETGGPIVDVARGELSLARCAAALTAARMAGMMSRMMDLCVAYVSDRKQFGRTLSQFQAIQHQLAVMAEQVVSAGVAARIGMSGSDFHPARVAVAKCRVSEASAIVAGIAHAVHGAIGVTAEVDLQLYTRRLKQGQIAFGAESYWAMYLARARILSASTTSADYVRENLRETVALS